MVSRSSGPRGGAPRPRPAVPRPRPAIPLLWKRGGRCCCSVRIALNFREARAGGGAARASAGLPRRAAATGFGPVLGPAGAFLWGGNQDVQLRVLLALVAPSLHYEHSDALHDGTLVMLPGRPRGRLPRPVSDRRPARRVKQDYKN